MNGETSSALLGSSSALALIGYALFSVFVSGQVVGERMVAKSDWPQICHSKVLANVERKDPPITKMPRIGCSTIFSWFGPDGEAYCQVHGHLFDNNPLNTAIDIAEQKQRDAQKKRYEWAAKRAKDRCECATTVTLEKRRVPLGIYAGALRIIEPNSVKNLQSDLVSSLNSSACAMKGEG